jgi:HSP20 family protein
MHVNVNEHLKAIREASEAKKWINDMLSSNLFVDDTYLRSDIIENEKEFIINCEIPGIKKEDISILFEDSFLKIKANSREELENEGVEFILKEIKKGKFQRSFKLKGDFNPENIEAKHENGLLIIKIPKNEVKKKEFSVKIK